VERSNSPTAQRGSIAFGISRLLARSSFYDFGGTSESPRYPLISVTYANDRHRMALLTTSSPIRRMLAELLWCRRVGPPAPAEK
jgi:hypothetical protein